MDDYIMKNVRLLKIADGKRNAGNLYLRFTAVNVNCRQDKGEVTTLDEDWANDFAQYVAIAQQDGTDAFGNPNYKPSALLDQTKPIPEDLLQVFNGEFEQYYFPGGPRVALQDDGTSPRLGKAGQLQIYEKIDVFTIRYKSKDGTFKYAKGWDPESRGASIANNFYAPLSQYATSQPMGVRLPQQEEAPLINGGTAPVTAPAGAPSQAMQPGAPVTAPGGMPMV